MQDQSRNTFEKPFEANRQENSEKSAYYSEIATKWESVMGDATSSENVADTDAAPADTESFSDNKIETQKTGTAETLAGYGLNVACREYSLDSVLNAILSTDEGDFDSQNPIASVYERLSPNREERMTLFGKIQGDSEYQRNYKQNKHNTLEQQQAISDVKDLVNALRTNPKFETARQHAAKEGKDIVSYIVREKVNPTLSDLLELVEENADVEEVAEKLVKEAEAEFQEENGEDEESQTAQQGQQEFNP